MGNSLTLYVTSRVYFIYFNAFVKKKSTGGYLILYVTLESIFSLKQKCLCIYNEMEPENTKQKKQAIKEIFKDIHDTLSSSEIK